MMIECYNATEEEIDSIETAMARIAREREAREYPHPIESVES